ncbi:hypothetical protein bpr_II410 (plasmid) [Butyrivibrio proteoclasticus B316]|uniref:Uncharacterized protein n=1 Tax=Butyrivibrio proteoclasticus (strain ATCC 51982 / DSM 14932 / B316) TaxID=515622 RepID=E0S4L5_BUTPB|nr:hypothetical protein [Butyrivibrio proteoclasticus]ADL36347.1 hypothetical protein bpr_II410 [Butyrivibrio proteoclasticus B316]
MDEVNFWDIVDLAPATNKMRRNFRARKSALDQIETKGTVDEKNKVPDEMWDEFWDDEEIGA